MNSTTHISLPSSDAFRRVATTVRSLLFGIGVVCLVGGLALLWLSFAEKNKAYISFGPAAVPEWGRATLVLAGFLLSLAAVFFILSMLRKKYGLVINKEGLTFYRPIFSEVFVPWMTIQGIAFSQDQSKMVGKWRDHRAILWLEDRQRVSLNKYIHPHDLPEVVTRIKAELYPQLEIRLRNSLNAGEEISFGPIGLNKNGVICRTNHYTWDQISQIFIDKGILKVEMSGGNVFHQSLRYIPNLEILILLVREFEKS